jgi:hypothetical protein
MYYIWHMCIRQAFDMGGYEKYRRLEVGYQVLLHAASFYLQYLRASYTE